MGTFVPEEAPSGVGSFLDPEEEPLFGEGPAKNERDYIPSYWQRHRDVRIFVAT